MKFLFHGSSTQGIKKFIPNISLELKSRVYATEDICYALVRAGQQNDEIREEYNGEEGIFELAECYPEAFKDTFEGPGSVYLVNKNDFRINPDDTDEYISETEVQTYGEIKYDSIWNAMQQFPERFRFVYYGTDEWNKYWSRVRGGLDGYLNRKLTRKEKMMEMRAAK